MSTTLTRPRPVPQFSSIEKLALCEKTVTLNGEKARISGVRSPFAKVTSLSTGLSCEFSWAAVARITARGGAFSS